ncbi:MAG: hypothetical protein IJ803_02235 [Oribacterium sp.]|nr:hypothetical protein [Oribacterium sp.]
MNDKKLLNENELLNVAGGVRRGAADAEQKKREFEAAWKTLGMEEKGFSGMRRAELFDEWASNNYTPDVTAFLASVK